MQRIETDRTIISPLELSDAPFIFTLLNSPGWLRFIGNRGIHNLQDASNFMLNGPMKSYRDNGFGLCLVSEKESGEKMGLAGLLQREQLDSPDLGFAFLPQYQGKGYAFESSVAIISFAASNLHSKKVYAFTDPENSRSISLLIKTGFQFVRMMPWPASKELKLFSLKLPVYAPE